MQLKRDLLEERLTCADTTAALLASHLLQCEYLLAAGGGGGDARGTRPRWDQPRQEPTRLQG